MIEARDAIAVLMDFVRENGKEIDEENPNNQTWEIVIEGEKVTVQSEDEYTNRIKTKTLDVRENTFNGIRYSLGGYDDLIEAYKKIEGRLPEGGKLKDGIIRDTEMGRGKV